MRDAYLKTQENGQENGDMICISRVVSANTYRVPSFRLLTKRAY